MIRLAAAGSDVILADIDTAGLAQTAELAAAHGRKVVAVACDVTSDEDIARAVAAARSLGGTVRVVVANAGVAVGGQFQHVPVSEWARIVDVNVLGVVRTIRAFLPDMIAAGRGAVVITSSVQGLLSESADMAPYVTTKAALVGMARSLAAFTRPLGVNVTLLCPGLTATAFPGSARMWGHGGPGRRVMTLPPGADTAGQVADLLVGAVQSGRFLASAVPDIAQRLAAWAVDPDAALPPLR